MTTTFLFPFFNKSEQGKVNDRISVAPSEHELHLQGRNTCIYGAIPDSERHGAVSAISSQGFPAKQEGTYVFVAYVENVVEEPMIEIGWTSQQTVDSTLEVVYCGNGLNGASLSLSCGFVSGGSGVEGDKKWDKKHFNFKISQKAKEIIALMTISKKGTRSVQYIIDGLEGRVQKLDRTDFENENGGNQIFPVVSLFYGQQKVKIIPFSAVKSRSPKIDELMKEFHNNDKVLESPKQQRQIKKAPKVATAKPSVVKKTVTKKVAEKKAPAKKKTAKKAIKATKNAGKKASKK